MAFLPVSPDELNSQPDFIIVTGDAYVDHSSFGTAVIGRVLEAEGYSVAIIPQPRWDCDADVKRFGAPRLAFLVNSGNIDSMVAHYTAAKKRRSEDCYSPGGKAGLRPDRAIIVYCNLIRQAFGSVPIVIGGVEASTRRFAHYDYHTDKLRRSILLDSRADLLTYGMGENILRRVAFLLAKGVPIGKLRDIRGTCFVEKKGFEPKFPSVSCGRFEELSANPRAFAEAFAIQAKNQDSATGKALIEDYGDRITVQNPPMPPLTTAELDRVFELPYERAWHPMYDSFGGIPALSEVKFSLTHNRGCYGNCSFCSIAFLQGRQVVCRSIESVVREARILASLPDFKGYIHDVGGATANFRLPLCKSQQSNIRCSDRECLYPSICKNAVADHSDYLALLSAVSAVPGVKKVFIRSGIRHDFVNADKSERFMRALVEHHVSGQLRLAPEHVSPTVLALMGKPPIGEYEKFTARFNALSEKAGLEQYVVPYLMSSHPGSRIEDAIELALYLKKAGIRPEQVQDFYPTPGTASTCMFYTGLDPFTMKPVYVPRSDAEKHSQRILLQAGDPKNRSAVARILKSAGREDLIPVLLGAPARKGIRGKK